MNAIDFMCPSCNVEVHPLGISHLIKPFWRRLPGFLSYPLKPVTLGFIILFGFIAGFTHHTLTFNALVTYLCFLPAYLICLFIVLIYCNNVFHQTSKGDLNPPFMDVSLEGIPWPVLKQVALFFGIHFFGYTISRHLGISSGVVACELAKIPLPAMFLLLLVNGSLLSAINPLYVFLLIKKIGRHYLLLYIFTSLPLLAAFAAPYLINQINITGLPIAPFIFYSLINYCLVVIYNLLGYVMLQYSEELDVQIDYVTFLRCSNKEQLEQHLRTDPLYNDAQILVGQGKADSALELIRNETEGKFDNPDLALLYLKLLDLQGENDKLRWVGGPIIDLLAAHGRMKDCVHVYYNCFRDKPIVLPGADALYKLHDHFFRAKKLEEAVHCAELLIEKHPNNHRSPNLHLTCAGLAITHFKKRKKATTLLLRFLKLYPENSRIAEAKKMLAWLKKTNSATRNQM